MHYATRPLSVVNTDNRVLASALRYVVEPGLAVGDSLVQRGFLPGRSMNANILEIELESRPAHLTCDQAALVLFERALAAHPADPDYAYFVASAQLALGRTEEGASGLRTLLRRNPEHLAACNDLAWLLAERGEDLDLAVALANRAARLDPRPEVLDTLGWVRLRRGEIGPAIAALEKALEEQPEFSTAHYHLGLALVQRGDQEAARQAFRAALDAGPFPESEAARQELERLASQEATSL